MLELVRMSSTLTLAGPDTPFPHQEPRSINEKTEYSDVLVALMEWIHAAPSRGAIGGKVEKKLFIETNLENADLRLIHEKATQVFPYPYSILQPTVLERL